MKKAILLSILLFYIGSASYAKVRKDCKVKYSSNYQWSELYEVEVQFSTGSELNQATNSFDYEAFSVYAVIFWSNGGVSLIKLTTNTICGGVVSSSCISSFITYSGIDKTGVEWSICTGSFCN